MPSNAIASIASDLSAERGEVERLARRAEAAGCDWAKDDLSLYFSELTEVQRADTALLPQVISYWRRRFLAAAENPSMRRPPYVSLLQAQELLSSKDSRLGNLSQRDPQRFHDFLARFESAADVREKALLLRSAEAAASMLPPGLTLGQPTPPVAEAQKLLAQLRSAGVAVSLTSDGRIAIAGVISEAQRLRLRDLKPQIAGLLEQPNEVL